MPLAGEPLPRLIQPALAAQTLPEQTYSPVRTPSAREGRQLNSPGVAAPREGIRGIDRGVGQRAAGGDESEYDGWKFLGFHAGAPYIERMAFTSFASLRSRTEDSFARELDEREKIRGDHPVGDGGLPVGTESERTIVTDVARGIRDGGNPGGPVEAASIAG